LLTAAPLILESMLRTSFDASEAHRVHRRTVGFAGDVPMTFPALAEFGSPDREPERGPNALVVALRAVVAWTRRPLTRSVRRDATLG
jgi:hypothetical protein